MAGETKNDRDAKIDALVAQVAQLRDTGAENEVAALLAAHPDVADSVEGFLNDQDIVLKAVGQVPQASIDTDANEVRQTKLRDGNGSNAANPPRRPHKAAVESTPTVAMALPAKIVSGEKPFGRYRIEKQLGEGAMGAVYLAHDTQLDREVALKTPKFNSDNAERLGKRFRREAQSAATLHHRNICPVYDVGQIDGVDYMTMAFIDGKPLSAYVNSEKPLALRQVALVIRKLAVALQAAHDAGVVHRDLKPSNVIIDREGEPVVMDFGLAGRVDAAGDSQLTRTGTILGTPAYMSPEQIEGAQKLIGPRTDIYALGVVMFELLTGRLPFRGSPASVMGKALVAKPPSIADLRGGVDPELVKLCESMMVKHPAKRIGTMREVAEKLTGWIRHSRKAEQAAADTSSSSGPPPTSSGPPPTFSGPPPVPSIVTTGEELAALSRQAASRWRDDSKNLSDARKTHQVAPAGLRFRAKAWFNSLPPRNRRLVAAAGAALPLLLLGVTIVIKITVDDEGNTNVVVVDDDVSVPEAEAVATDQEVVASDEGAVVTKENPPSLAVAAAATSINDAAPIDPQPITSKQEDVTFGPWINLFNGNGTSQWDRLGTFRVEDDELVSNRKGAARSRDSFGDFELQFEWKLENGGNSGVYYRAYPGAGINVWPTDSAEFALDATHRVNDDASNGALWNVLAPATNHYVNPQRFRNAKIVCAGTSVEHWIGDKLVLKYDTSSESFQRALMNSDNHAFKEAGPRPNGKIYLQSNVGEIRFRNIRIRSILVDNFESRSDVDHSESSEPKSPPQSLSRAASSSNASSGTPTGRRSRRRPQRKILPIDVTRTYFKTAPNDSARPAIPIDLEKWGYAEGDTIRLRRVGSFNQGENRDPRLYGLFSSSRTVKEHTLLHRVPGAINANQPAWSCKIWATFGGGETDIPEDFAIADYHRTFDSTTVKIPPGARYLFVSPWNGAVAIPSHDPSDLAVEICLVSKGDD
jgi:serine/threonine protein kinase